MSQFDWGALNAATTTGEQLAQRLSDGGRALLSNHMGPSRPAYAVNGMIWVDDSHTANRIKYFDGSSDHLIGSIRPGGFNVRSVACDRILFSNIDTGMLATNVQDAIVELNAKIEALTP